MGACLIRNAEHPRQQCIFPASGGNKNAPVIEELPISLECRVEEINQYNATLRIVAEIVNVSVDEKDRRCMAAASSAFREIFLYFITV